MLEPHPESSVFSRSGGEPGNLHFKFPSEARAAGLETTRFQSVVSYTGLEYGEDQRIQKGGVGLGRRLTATSRLYLKFGRGNLDEGAWWAAVYGVA